LSGGDLIGASPLVSAVFHDEPTVEAMNSLNMNFAVVGNHEFDEGVPELLRIQNGGCNPIDGCQSGHTYGGANFEYLAANVIGPDGRTILPPYAVVNVGGTKIGLIGVVTTETPTIVMPSAVAGLTFLDETSTVNKYAAELRQRQVNTIVVLLHAGNPKGGGLNTCPTLDPKFESMITGMDSAVKVVISGHSHQTYNCTIGGKIVTQAKNAGRVLTDIDLTIDRGTGKATTATATNINVDRALAPDPAESELLNAYTTLSAPLANQLIGSITADLTRTTNAAGESAIGDVLADAQLAATSSATTGNAVVAMTNPGGIRKDLLYAEISGGEQAGQVTYGEAFAVQPFSNILTTLTYTGAQLKAVLEQQATSGNILQISDSLRYTWTASAPLESRVSNLTINGTPVDMAGSYRVTVNNFLAGGGDGFTRFVVGTNPLIGVTDLDALVAYFAAESPVAPGAQDRITLVP
ncbi:MAG: bifunctional metallophosphatase/5'-nucleotidase, partial [Chloroflexi bacterium]|nr:bifunctional metallophosphatase/5'-nucleotidase [Chloroflexota bacterium]